VCAYDLTGPEVLTSPQWMAGCEKGRWAAEIRPHALNRTPGPGGQTVWEQIPC
jgi:hypothetical protein